MPIHMLSFETEFMCYRTWNSSVKYFTILFSQGGLIWKLWIFYRVAPTAVRFDYCAIPYLEPLATGNLNFYGGGISLF